MAKLTLHVDDDLIRVAKELAAERNISVSKLVSDFFRNFAPAEATEIAGLQLTPKTKSLIGIIPDDTEDDYVEYLEKKYS